MHWAGFNRLGLDTWHGQCQGLTPQKRGPKPDPQAVEITRLRRESERLPQAEKIIEALPESSQRRSTGRSATKSQAWRSIRTDARTSLNPMAALIVACRDTVIPELHGSGLSGPYRTYFADCLGLRLLNLPAVLTSSRRTRLVPLESLRLSFRSYCTDDRALKTRGRVVMNNRWHLNYFCAISP